MKNFIYWSAINQIEGLGPVRLKKLREQYPDPEELARYLQADLQAGETEQAKLLQHGYQALTIDDEAYPRQLKNIHDPPTILYLRGEQKKLSPPIVGIVGTRKPTRYGLEQAQSLATALQSAGVTVVSGLAIGIDAAAHQGAPSSIAVLGSGIDNLTPHSNRRLADRLLKEGGLIVSEYPLGQAPAAWTFPQRNRIIAGLSLGVIVIEGAYQSGAMITAKLALEQGREVFALPGQVGLEQTQGPHWLIKQGAKLIENINDVLDELNLAPGRQLFGSETKEINLSETEKQILAVLSREAKALDLIAAEINRPVQQLLGDLLILEMKQAVRQLPGKYFVLA